MLRQISEDAAQTPGWPARNTFTETSVEPLLHPPHLGSTEVLEILNRRTHLQRQGPWALRRWDICTLRLAISVAS